MSERRVTDMSRERKLDWLSNTRPMGFTAERIFWVDKIKSASTNCMEGVGTRHSTIGQTALCLHLPSLPTAASLCVDVTCRPTVPAGPIMSSPYYPSTF